MYVMLMAAIGAGLAAIGAGIGIGNLGRAMKVLLVSLRLREISVDLRLSLRRLLRGLPSSL